MENSVTPYQQAFSEYDWSVSTLISNKKPADLNLVIKWGYIQQYKG